jgi:hypothetical protein
MRGMLHPENAPLELYNVQAPYLEAFFGAYSRHAFVKTHPSDEERLLFRREPVTIVASATKRDLQCGSLRKT